ncbi:type II toxin-antitoxin system Phd/YefM family antitoxin [uncultured Roseovarius sp.]|uniref:type II toxin-antitoxin system Phd/YefM family antitoxin n=1 Tax=uncultured Roseovarius sp. TaxID=293344 RepID=UPI00260CB8EB|nr:type II toxin-antitoxin system Phd/YefM family antitoxin [uncultured Roseovarius sp.]
MYDEIGAREFRCDLRRILDAMRPGGRRVMILRNGVPVAGLVPSEELLALEKASGSRMEYHEQMQQTKLREIRWLKEGLDGLPYGTASE